MNILLIEDDLSTVESIKLCFEIHEPGSNVISTNKGLDAIQMIKDSVFDAVIIDLGLPDVDGTQVVESLRHFSSIPALVLSARHSPDVISKALALGANDYITKPFDYKSLLNRLNELIMEQKKNNSKPV
jgi:DNA-binding response OmpR family regulator